MPSIRPAFPRLATPSRRGMLVALATAAVGVAAALAQTLAHAAPAPLPAGFDVAARHETTHAAWSVLSGESPNVLDRGLVERTCAMKRSIGATTSTPVFESGTDRPDAVQIVHIASTTATAGYETIRGTVCDPATLGATGDICGCTFRQMTSRYIHIRRTTGGETEVIDVDLTKGTGSRRTRRAAPGGAASAPDLAVLGPVVGHDVVAGVPCSVRRQDLGTGRTDRCLADAADNIPPTLRLQELARTMYLLGPGGPERRDWRRTDRLDADAEVDLGVFDPPAGIAWRTATQEARRP